MSSVKEPVVCKALKSYYSNRLGFIKLFHGEKEKKGKEKLCSKYFELLRIFLVGTGRGLCVFSFSFSFLFFFVKNGVNKRVV